MCQTKIGRGPEKTAASRVGVAGDGVLRGVAEWIDASIGGFRGAAGAIWQAARHRQAVADAMGLTSAPTACGSLARSRSSGRR